MKSKILERWLKKALVLTAALMLGGMLANPASAALLNLTPKNPDIASWNVNTFSSAGVFNSHGWVEDLKLDSGASPVLDYDFDITASVDAMGNLASLGTHDLDIFNIYDNSLHYLTGTLTAFSGQDQVLEFLFNVTGGSLKDLFGPVAGVILNENAQVADTFSVPAPVPEPSTISLMLLAMGGMYLRKRRSVKIS